MHFLKSPKNIRFFFSAMVVTVLIAGGLAGAPESDNDTCQDPDEYKPVEPAVRNNDQNISLRTVEKLGPHLTHDTILIPQVYSVEGEYVNWSTRLSPYTKIISHFDDQIVAGAYLKNSQFSQPNYYTWQYSRTYLKVPVEIHEEGKVIDAKLTMTTSTPVPSPRPLSVSPVTEYWDDQIMFDAKYFDRGGVGTYSDVLPEHDFFYTEVPAQGSANSVTSWNVTQIVDDWFTGGSANGLVVIGNETLYDPQQTTEINSINHFYGPGTGNLSPVLDFDCVYNKPPVAQITSQPQPALKQGNMLSFTATASDPDGDGITLYEWSSDRDGLLTLGPGVTSLNVDNLSVGLHKINLRVKDDYTELEKWSNVTFQNVRVLENAPEVVDIHVQSQGSVEDVRTFPLGTDVVIKADVHGGHLPLSGSINITDWAQGMPLITDAVLNNDLEYLWNTSEVYPGSYRVDIEITDSKGLSDLDGLLGDGPDAIITLVDDQAPEIEWVNVSSSEGYGPSFLKGETLTLKVKVKDANEMVTGQVSIFNSFGEKMVFPGSLGITEDPGVYRVVWNTATLDRADMFTLEITIEDLAQNKAVRLINVTILDADAPHVGKVEAYHGSEPGTSFPVATAISVVVVEDTLETGLSGHINIRLQDEYVIFEEPLQQMGDGRYFYPWNTQGFDHG